MGCAGIGDLRALLDRELRGEARGRAERHLASCPGCQAALEELRAGALLAGSALDRLAPAEAEIPRVPWSQIRERAEGRGSHPVTLGWRVSDMLGVIFGFVGGSRVRRAATAASLLVAVVLLFTLPPVQTAAGGFLSIFRVQKLVAVTVDPSSLPNLAAPSDLGSFTVAGDKKPRQVGMAEAERTVGFKVKTPASLPSGLEAEPRSVTVTGATTVNFTPDLKKVRAYLSSIGASNVKLPDNLDGAPITLQMPPAVAVLYTERGGVDRQPDGTVKPLVGQRFLYLGTTAGPTLNVPDGIDVERVRTEMLKVPGLPPDLVNQLKAIEDWRNTVVVPVVKGISREVTVQGEKGLMITESEGRATTLLWLKGGIVYTLTGNAPEAEILAAANSLR